MTATGRSSGGSTPSSSPTASRTRWRPSSSAGAWTFVAALVAGACSSSSSSPTQPVTEVVVGIQKEQSLSGAVGTLHVVTKVGGKTNSDETLDPSALPHEVKVFPPAGQTSAPVAVQVDGYTQAGWTPKSPDMPVLVRTAETTFVPDETKLLRVLLQGQCLMALPGGPPGAPTCNEPTTCIGGRCVPDSVPAAALEPYESNWANDAPDACRPLDAGMPVVQVGEGQTDYLPLTSGEAVQMEQGPQGGHHIWLAVRQENLKQQGSTTTITSVQPGTNLPGPEMAFVFTFEQDQGGFCKLAGLRYQLDIDGTDYHQYLGKPLNITVKITDTAGHTGTGTASVNIDPTLLCPTGVPGC